jgi:hypothetical protein
VLLSDVALEQNDTTLHLNHESYDGHCSSWHFHPFNLTLNYQSADGQYRLQRLHDIFQLNKVLSHTSDKANALQSLVSPKTP